MSKPFCKNNAPPWFTGHWRDWHRGHDCDRDDGQPRTEDAQVEIAQHEVSAATGYLTDAELRMLRARTTSGDALLVRALDELLAWRVGTRIRDAFVRSLADASKAPFDHSARTTKHFENLLGYCVCAHCQKLPEREEGP